MLQVGLCNLDGVILSLCLRVLIRALLSLRADIRCPFCSKSFPGGRIEDHLLSCLTSPPLPYNSKCPITGGAWCSKLMVAVCLPVRVCVCACAADVLCKDSGECSICLEDLAQGETIARLPCLCVYHKR